MAEDKPSKQRKKQIKHSLLLCHGAQCEQQVSLADEGTVRKGTWNRKTAKKMDCDQTRLATGTGSRR